MVAVDGSVPASAERGFERRWTYALGAIAGILVFAAMAVQIDGDRAGPLELAVFRAVNDLPGFLSTILWAPMQLGNFLVLPLAAVAALVVKRWRPSLALVLAGAGKYAVARLVKDEFIRHRPAVFLDEVRLGLGSSDSGLGFVSGHAIVAVAFATIVHPYLGSVGGRVVLWVGAATVCVGRVLVGAHLPMDVVGGAGLGLAMGAVANLLVGTPRR